MSFLPLLFEIFFVSLQMKNMNSVKIYQPSFKNEIRELNIGIFYI